MFVRHPPRAAHLVLQHVECHGILPLLLSTSGESICCTEQRMGWLAQTQNPSHHPALIFCSPSGQSRPHHSLHQRISNTWVLPWPHLSLLCSLRAAGGGRGPAELASLWPSSAFSQQPTDLSEDGLGEWAAGSSPSGFRLSSF